MKKFILGLLLLSTSAFAALSESDKQIIYQNNLITNGGFENNKSGWTATTATFSIDTTNVFKGNASGLLTFSSQTGGLSNSVTPTAQIASVNMEATCAVKTSLTTIQVCSLTGGVQGNCQIAPPTNTWQYVSINFTGPSNGTSVGVQIATTASTTGTVNIDDCYVGPARNLSQVSQAQLVGGVIIQGCANPWATSSTSLTDYPVQTTCTYTTFGTAQAPSTMIPAVTFPSLPAGEYMLVGSGAFYQGTNADAFWQFWDGTNTARELSNVVNGGSPTINQSINYSTAQSNVTLSIRSKVGSGTSNIYATSGRPFVIRVYSIPSSTQLAYSPNITPASWSGYHDSTCAGWNAPGTSYGDPSGLATCGFFETTNRNFGTVTSALSSGNKLPGIVFTPPRLGRYMVKVSGLLSCSSSGAFGSAQLVDGTGVVYDRMQMRASAANAYGSVTLVGIVDVTSISSKTLKIQFAASAGTCGFDPGNAATTYGANWVVVELDAPMPTPFLDSNPVYISYYASANVSAGTATPINYDTMEYSSASGLVQNAATSPTGLWRFIAPSPGLYLVMGNQNCGAATYAQLYKNGSSYKTLGQVSPSSGITGVYMGAVLLNATDYIDVRPSSTCTVSGGALNAGAIANIEIMKIR